MSLRLIIEDDEGSTTVVPLASDAITIGRQQGNTIQLTEKNVSRRHARLYPEADGWVIEDLGSYNGVKVNNDAVDGRTKLREGDVVEIGDYHLAITEDVDKSPLNFRTGGAANDGVVEPMLVSSSADLPRLSAEDIAALQAGQQPIGGAPRGGALLVDSGPVPAGHYHPGYAEPESGKKTGLYVFLGIVVLGIAALAVFWVITQNDGSGEVAAGAGGKAPDGKGEPAKAVVPPPTPDAGDGTPDPADAGEAVIDDGGTPDVAEGGEPVADDEGEEPVPGEGGEEPLPGEGGEPVADDEGGDEPVEVVEDKPSKPKPRNTKPKQPKQKPDPKPNVDPAALIEEARQKQWKDPSIAYRLAKQSYGAKPSSEALWVMGPAACRMKDRSKVDWVMRRLKGADKTRLADICAQKGFPL